MAADTPDNYPPLAVERTQPNFFDLNGWYVRTDAGRVRTRFDAAQAGSGHASPAGGGVFSQATFKNPAAHDVWIGMRWSFDDAARAK